MCIERHADELYNLLRRSNGGAQSKESTMGAFKVGDKVRLIRQGKYGNRWDGDMQVTEVYSSGSTATDRGGAFPHVELELVVEKPKRDYVADHARRTLRKAGLTKEQAKNFVGAVGEWPTGSKLDAVSTENRLDLSKLSRSTRGLKLSDIVGYGIAWWASPQGFDYWSALHAELIWKGI